MATRILDAASAETTAIQEVRDLVMRLVYFGTGCSLKKKLKEHLAGRCSEYRPGHAFFHYVDRDPNGLAEHIAQVAE
jgi:hypothetical protein